MTIDATAPPDDPDPVPRDAGNDALRRQAFGDLGGIGSWSQDLSKGVFSCDAAIAKLFALDPAEAAAGFPREVFLSRVHPDDRAGLVAVLAAGLQRSGDLEFEYRLLHPDGSVHWMLSRGHTYFDAAGKPVRRTGVGIDITKQRQSEEQRRQLQKLEADGQLTGGIANDFDDLLTVIRTSADLLRRDDISEARRERFLDSILKAATRGSRLTGQLLAFARRQELQPSVFDVGQDLQAIAEMMEALAGASVSVELDLCEGHCHVRADPGQFDTAMVNLAINARDAMPGGGRLTMRVRVAQRIPSLRGQPAIEGRFVAVSMIDTGSGIEPRYLTQIFEPFFTTKGGGPGTGLGLSQVFGFARQSGGDIEVDSTVGQGSRFTLYLPHARPDPRSMAGQEAQASTSTPTFDGGEAARLAELDAMQVLDSDAELAFDEMAELAARVCAAPIALVSLVDADRLWFKARVGMQAHTLPRSGSFCDVAIAEPDAITEIPDATRDARFTANPLVHGPTRAVFYAGAPLVTRHGHAIGTLCVIDTVSRTLDAKQRQILRLFADKVVERLESRRTRLLPTE